MSDLLGYLTIVIPGNIDTTVRSWTLNPPISGQHSPLSTYRGHSGPVRAVAYADERIVSGSDDARIAIWDKTWEGESDEPLRKISGHESAVLSISVSGDKIFSSSEDKTIRVWNLDTGDNLSIIRGHTAPINEIKLSRDGRWIVSASDDSSLRIWDWQNDKLLTLPQYTSFWVLSVDISRDGQLIAYCGVDGRVHTWRPDLRPDMAPAWPDSFTREMCGQVYCPIDDQGILANPTFKPTLRGGWMYGPSGPMGQAKGEKEEAMCWIPPAYQRGLLQQSVCVLGARETALDMRNFTHGTNWEQCASKKA